MKNYRIQALASVAIFALGAGFTLGVQSLRAQAKPPAYVISEIDVTNQDGYMKEFAPLATKAIEAAGGKGLAQGGRIVGLTGDPPKSRVVLRSFDNIEQAQAAYSTPAYLEARKIGDKYAKFRVYAVEGLPK